MSEQNLLLGPYTNGSVSQLARTAPLASGPGGFIRGSVRELGSLSLGFGDVIVEGY